MAQLRHGLVALMLMALWVLGTARRWQMAPVTWPPVQGACWIEASPPGGPLLRCLQPDRPEPVRGRGSETGGLRPLREGERFALGWPLDLNQALQTELTLLPGIGPVRAKAIGAYRDRQGTIDRLEDLIEIKGIGPKTVGRLRIITQCGRSGTQPAKGASP